MTFSCSDRVTLGGIVAPSECELQPLGESHFWVWGKKGIKALLWTFFLRSVSLNFSTFKLYLEWSSEHCRMSRPQLMWQARGKFFFGNSVTDPDSMFVAHKAASFKALNVNNCKFRLQVLFLHCITHCTFWSIWVKADFRRILKSWFHELATLRSPCIWRYALSSFGI